MSLRLLNRTYLPITAFGFSVPLPDLQPLMATLNYSNAVPLSISVDSGEHYIQTPTPLQIILQDIRIELVSQSFAFMNQF
jgi:hypothetical protein